MTISIFWHGTNHYHLVRLYNAGGAEKASNDSPMLLNDNDVNTMTPDDNGAQMETQYTEKRTTTRMNNKGSASLTMPKEPRSDRNSIPWGVRTPPPHKIVNAATTCFQ